MDEINDLINKRINKLGLRRSIDAAYIVVKAGELSQGRFTAKSFRGGVLTVTCPNSAEATKVKYSTSKIIDEINKSFNKEIIKNLRVIVKS